MPVIVIDNPHTKRLYNSDFMPENHPGIGFDESGLGHAAEEIAENVERGRAPTPIRSETFPGRADVPEEIRNRGRGSRDPEQWHKAGRGPPDDSGPPDNRGES